MEAISLCQKRSYLDTYVHVVKAFVDVGKRAAVGDVLIDLHLALEVV